MKKFLILLLPIILVSCFIRYNYTISKSTDIKYVIEEYFTTGILNSYKMCTVSKVNLSFSNGNIAVVKIDGMEDKSPHKKVSYNVFLEKNNKGNWKVKKVYTLEPNLNSN
ncbi:hypothetical protein HBE96_20945 [Clostridium sp. P21]|uniref:Lipoprotein n=1 Tax=Clostridium muellerianum TaxID=2716538 RepID=A0A7Y0HPH7_9CLOT|nr:hypothetical protein [Clostridium muellerianum]NMM65054.1 hypothetical protein [Clostridium muellerianum]